MTMLDIVVLGPEGADRDVLEETVRRLGHSSFAADPSRVAGLPPRHGDVLMLDLRGEERGWGELTDELLADERPLVIVADRPRRMVQTLAGRAAGTLLLTGAEDDSGYRVALTLCAALCGTRRPAPRRRRASGWIAGPALRAAPAL
ncbi:MAG TPA: hypothetical protein VNT51_12130 [Miltoncostaeaceae bacterium]|jgi:hypothetical protein|nr:hypothetical protein [Miltoncostaeaceae bacterium]